MQSILTRITQIVTNKKSLQTNLEASFAEAEEARTEELTKDIERKAFVASASSGLEIGLD